ncbi:uncharacterized protein FIBRA_01061 [Fibroporia radiculosa]|uniref:GAF domain-containing protein n=1 Tax=Fibroporia radiculosa TaxID=599839 RepID=J4GJ82_9APHY|nr:uncharacterized protein FIBRA_01061 [Fibroporia radiculosa]CCL99050.1 predicted protein [Fibroporia radiculosa]
MIDARNHLSNRSLGPQRQRLLNGNLQVRAFATNLVSNPIFDDLHSFHLVIQGVRPEMPHADSALIPSGLNKSAFWQHVHVQLAALLEGQRNWVTNLANASSLIYSSLLAYEPYFGHGERAVNWCGAYFISALLPDSVFGAYRVGPALIISVFSGFYVVARLFPQPQITQAGAHGDVASEASHNLLLGPFCGKPACQFINTTPDQARGVCADAFIRRQTALVPDVNAYPGHIACDGETQSEIVCPLIVKTSGYETVVGVLDLDCLALGGFTEEDQQGLEGIANLLVQACDW